MIDGLRLGVTSSVLASQQVHFQRVLGPNLKEISQHLQSRTHHCLGGYQNSQNYRSLNSWPIYDQPELGPEHRRWYSILWNVTVQTICNITFTNSREFIQIFSKFYQKLRISYEFRVQNSHMNLRTNSCKDSSTKPKQKKKFVREISEITARILNKERNLCTNLNKPTRLHQERHSKTSSFDN